MMKMMKKVPTFMTNYESGNINVECKSKQILVDEEHQYYNDGENHYFHNDDDDEWGNFHDQS